MRNMTRDTSYEQATLQALTEPIEAAAYIEAVLEMDDPAALLVALRQVAKAHGMAVGRGPSAQA